MGQEKTARACTASLLLAIIAPLASLLPTPDEDLDRRKSLLVQGLQSTSAAGRRPNSSSSSKEAPSPVGESKVFQEENVPDFVKSEIVLQNFAKNETVSKDLVESETESKDLVESETESKDLVESETESKDLVESETESKDLVESETESKDLVESETESKDLVESETVSTIIKIRCVRQEHLIYKCEEISDLLPDKTSKDTFMRLMEDKVNCYRELKPEERTQRHDSIGSFLSDTEENLFRSDANETEKETVSLASRLLETVQELATAIANDLPPGNNTTIQGGKMLIFGIKVNMSVSVGAKFQNFPTNSEVPLSDIFEIPFASLQGLKGAVPISLVVSDRLGAWMTPDVSVKNVIVSRVISVSIEGLSGNLSQPVNFTMAHLKQVNDTSRHCSFWQPSTKKWLSSGCKTEKVSQNYTSCSCNHLTSFAVLMDVTPSFDNHKDLSNDGSGGADDQGSGGGGGGGGGGGDDGGRSDDVSGGGDDGDGRDDGGGRGTGSGRSSSSDDHVLSYITTVLLSISIICLLFSLITFVSCKSLYSERNTIHINFVLCLAAGQLVFVLGIDQTDNKIICAVIAGLLHFLFLCAFCWMLLEGLQIYRKLVVVFDSKFSWTPVFFAIGYGVPAIIITLCASVNRKGYGTPTMCWLSSERGFHWSFIGPVLVILVFNIIMLCVAVRIMWHHLTFGTLPQKQEDEKISTMIKGSASLSVLLGTGWLLGAFQIGALKIAMAYIFTLLNSVQGIFIFGFHCLGNSKVRKEYRKALRQATWIPMPIRVGLYKLVATPSTAEMEPISTSGASASGTFTKMFQSHQEGGKINPEMSTCMTNLRSISITREEKSSEQITQFTERVDSHEQADKDSRTDPQEVPDEKPEKVENEKMEKAEKEEKMEKAEKEKKDGDKDG